MWLDIQKTIKDNKAKAPRLGKTHNALLPGFLKCRQCGSSMTVVHGDLDANGNKRFYYCCSKILESQTKLSSCYENINDIIDALKQFYSTIDFEDFDVKKYIISTLIDKIIWDSTTGAVEIKL